MEEETRIPITPMRARIGAREFTWWSHNHEFERKRYLSSLSTDLILYKLNAYEGLEGGSRIVVLRQLQHEASEFMFALLGAYQDGVETLPVWMTSYQNQDVYSFSSKILDNDKSELQKLIDKITSDKGILFISGGRPISKILGKELILRHIEDIYRDFIMKHSKDEYTSTKHSYRVSSGESSFNISFEEDGDYERVVGGDFCIDYITSSRIASEGGEFKRSDVILNHSMVSHNPDYSVNAIKYIHQISSIIIECIKREFKTNLHPKAFDVPGHYPTLWSGRTFPGNGTIRQTMKDFYILPDKTVLGRWAVDLSVDSYSYKYTFASGIARSSHIIIEQAAMINSLASPYMLKRVSILKTGWRSIIWY